MNMNILEKINLRHYINKCFRFDKKHFVRYSRALKTKGPDHIISQIALCTHVVEKGLTMPHMKHGFGQELIIRLIGLCRNWASSYDQTNPFFNRAISVILEYDIVHKQLNHIFDDPFRSTLKQFVNDYNYLKPSNQIISSGADQFFYFSQSSFPEFSGSRHSIRNFSKKDVPVQSLIDSIKLAQNAPSACNRQSVRVHIVCENDKIQRILSIQNGNRGFSELVNRLLIVTFFIPCYGTVKERNLGYIDAGIFSMNLLYALHYNHIGACPLNWCDSPKDDKELRSAINIDSKETVTLIIACGFAPENEFKIAKSERIDYQSIITIH